MVLAECYGWLIGDGLNTYGYVNGDPIGFIDPAGLFKVHGNWCGPNHTHGFNKPWNELDDVQKSISLPLIDPLDSCCQNHDKEYASCREGFPCDNEKRAQCMQTADRKLSRCSVNSKRRENKHEKGASVIIENYMGGSSPRGK